MITALVGTLVLFLIGWFVSGRRRDALIPAAIIGGTIGLVLRQFDLLPGSIENWQLVGYHLFGISFLAIGLTRSEHKERPTGGALWMGFGQGFSFALQATVGGLVTLGLIAGGHDIFNAFGFLAPMGLEEGPGQAVSIGGVWESAGFVNAPTLGATIASVGFVAAYGFGLLALRLGRRDRTQQSPTATASTQQRLPLSRLMLPAIGVVVLYVATYWAVRWLAGLAGDEVRDTVLGVLFFIALLVGMGVRWLATRLGINIKPRAQQRITIAAVDGLTVAILASLAWSRIASDAGPLALVLGATLVASAAGVLFAARQLSQHRFDRSLALWGTVTGTVASGLALLSLSDPDNEAPVAIELGSSVVISAPMVLAGIAIATAAAQGGMTLAVATGVFAAATIAAAAVLVWVGHRFDSL